MKHLSFDSRGVSNQEETKLIIQKFCSEIKILNPEIILENLKMLSEKQFNSLYGNYQRSPIKKQGIIVGFLEIFIEENLKYITLYTSPS